MLEVRQTEVFQKWRRDLRDDKARAAIASRLGRLARGLVGDAKSVGGGVMEMRIHYGPGYRIYFTRRGREIVILLCGGDKDSQARDIEAAKALAEGIE
jgi:putative addiction module killer protein